MEQFKLPIIAKKAKSLFDDARQALKQNADAAISQKAKEVPTTLTSDNEKIRIAFVGQYGSGKSTILSLLTGKKLQIGGGVTTQTITELDWNGLTIMDTPGVHTQNRPDHDVITYDALAKADLVVFVLPSDGFSGYVGEHFRNLAITRNKAAEMMLVVNKMDNTAMGNTPEQQDIIFNNNIGPVIVPYTREGMYTSFIISKYWQHALTMTGPKQAEFLRRSGCDQFIDSLNRFVSDKGMMGKATTNLYQLEQLLTDIISKKKTGDDCADGVREILSRQRRALVTAKNNVKARAANIIRKETAAVCDYGDIIASELSGDTSKDTLQREIDKYQELTNEVYGKAVKQLEAIIVEENGEVDKEFESIAKSPLGQFVCRKIVTKVGSMDINPETMKMLGKWGEKMQNFGSALAKSAKGAGASGAWSNFFKISEASGSQAHSIVLKIGHLFGYKFAPWEATRWAARVGQAGKVLGAIGAIVGVLGQLAADHQEEQMEKQLRIACSNIRASFNNAAEVINMKFDENTQTWVEENYDTAIKEIDDNIAAIESATMKDKHDYQTLHTLRERTRALIAEAQRG